MSLFALTNHLFQKSVHVVNPCSQIGGHRHQLARLEPANEFARFEKRTSTPVG